MRYTFKKNKLGFVERRQKRTRQLKEQFAEFCKQRREALLSLNKETIQAFLIKHGEQQAALFTDDDPFWSAVRHAIIMDVGTPEEAKEEAREYLRANNWYIDEVGQLRKLKVSE